MGNLTLKNIMSGLMYGLSTNLNMIDNVRAEFNKALAMLIVEEVLTTCINEKNKSEAASLASSKVANHLAMAFVAGYHFDEANNNPRNSTPK